MKVLVTGGSGFIGSRLVRALCAAGYEVRVLTRRKALPNHYRGELVEHVQVDLLDPNCSLASIVSGCSVVFNCAGELRDESRMKALHVDATLKLISACKSQAALLGRSLHWVQLSSVGAYGPVIGSASVKRVVAETAALSPVGTYETTKARADELVVAAEDDLFSWSILRPSNVYGAGMPNDSLRQWARVIKRRLFFYVGARGAISTYVHVDDVVAALMLCGFDVRAKREVFNISNDCPQEELVNAMAKALNVLPPRIRVSERSMRMVANIFSGVRAFPLSASRLDSLVARTRYPSTKIESVLGYRPQRDLKDTVAEVLIEDGDVR